MGIKDGPGIRTVLFFQGCRLRCAYCHNPDTWKLGEGNMYEAYELLNKVIRFKPYFKSSGGGVTCSGGEPLMQPEFLKEFLFLCKQHNIHTTLDTSGYGLGDYDDILELTDLVILDLKHTEKKAYNKLTGGNIEEVEQFHSAIRRNNSKLWIRYVVVPGLNDSEADFENIDKKIKSFHNVEKTEFLPYHTLGVHKYTKMNIPYRLDQLINTSPTAIFI